jgi:outer membrane protein OmpA-like peptidoglycan-associated protein
MKHLSIRRSLMLGATFALILLTSSATFAQSKAGRISFGFNAGGNKYYGDYTDSRFEFQGEGFIRWNISDWFSLHAAYNGGVLGWKTTDKMIANENSLFPNSTGSSGGAVGTINHTRVGGWDLMASYNVFPEETFVPFVTAGIEALNFEPDDAFPAPLKGNAVDAYSKNVIGAAAGVGFEMYISPKVVFNGKGLLHLTGTDWIDDYSNPVTYRQDAYLTMGLGFSYYIFAPDITPALADNDRREVTNIYETNVYHTDTVYVRAPNDTVYLRHPRVNMIYNFPGTLFMVNTDQFNTKEPGNMQNLYNIRALVEQCPDMRIEVQGFASEEGSAALNQSLSERRALRIKTWLIAQDVAASKIENTIGYGETRPAVIEHTSGPADQLEAERTQNRRIAVRVVQACRER